MATREQVERWLDDATGYRPILDTEDRPAIVAMADMLERAAYVLETVERTVRAQSGDVRLWLDNAFAFEVGTWLAEWRGEAEP